jgi:hypothetical protein
MVPPCSADALGGWCGAYLDRRGKRLHASIAYI